MPDKYHTERAVIKVVLKEVDDLLIAEREKTEQSITKYLTKEESTTLIEELKALIPEPLTPTEAEKVDYDKILAYIVEQVSAIKVRDGVDGVDGVGIKGVDGVDGVSPTLDIPAIVEALLKVMPKIEVDGVDYVGIKTYIDEQVKKIKPQRAGKSGGGATSLGQLTDVVLSGLTQDARGNYILGGGGGHTIEDEGTPLTQRTKLNFVGAGVTVTDDAGDDATVVTVTGGGDVVGPASAVDSNFAAFDTTTGKLIKDSGSKASDFATAAQGSLADSAQQPPSEGAFVNGDKTKLDTYSEANQTANNAKISFDSTASTKVGHITVTQAVDLDTMESDIAALEQAVVLKGLWDASAGTFPGAGTAQAGFSYIVSVGGTVDGIEFVANDRLVAILDDASTTTYASNWHKLDYTDAVLSVAGRTGAVVLVKGDVGLGNVDNTTDADKPVSTAQQTALNLKANILTPTFTANITTPLIIGGTAVGSNLIYKSTTGAGTAAGIAHQFTGGTDGATVGMTILNNGNVGIGTASPGSRLDVDGDVNISTGSAYRLNGADVITAQTTLDNFFFGRAGNLTMTGTSNIAIGVFALLNNTTGSFNTATGRNALRNNTTGDSNTASGAFALLSNTAGNNNTAFGRDALLNNTTGDSNTATGRNALRNNTTGNDNTATGLNAGFDNTTGSDNTFLGRNTGRGITTGSNNTILGANVTGLAAGLANNIIIADGAGNQRLNIDASGNVGIGTTTPTEKLDIVSDKIRLRTPNTPASATSAGAVGEICWDANYIYVCVSTNTWKRTAISTW